MEEEEILLSVATWGWWWKGSFGIGMGGGAVVLGGKG